MKYLVFANQAEILAEIVTDSTLRQHFTNMAEKWRNLADFTATPNPYAAAAADVRADGTPLVH